MERAKQWPMTSNNLKIRYRKWTLDTRVKWLFSRKCDRENSQHESRLFPETAPACFKEFVWITGFSHVKQAWLRWSGRIRFCLGLFLLTLVHFAKAWAHVSASMIRHHRFLLSRVTWAFVRVPSCHLEGNVGWIGVRVRSIGYAWQFQVGILFRSLYFGQWNKIAIIRNPFLQTPQEQINPLTWDK